MSWRLETFRIVETYQGHVLYAQPKVYETLQQTAQAMLQAQSAQERAGAVKRLAKAGRSVNGPTPKPRSSPWLARACACSRFTSRLESLLDRWQANGPRCATAVLKDQGGRSPHS